MELRKVTAIIRADALETVERRLQELRVKGISVTHVMGYGEYANFYRRDWMCRHARIEIFTDRERARQIVDAIMEAAQAGGPGDGIVAVLPVEAAFRIRDRKEMGAGEM